MVEWQKGSINARAKLTNCWESVSAFKLMNSKQNLQEKVMKSGDLPVYATENVDVGLRSAKTSVANSLSRILVEKSYYKTFQ